MVSTRSSTTAARQASSSSPGSGTAFSHTPTRLTVLWLAISLPLVAWDTGYIFLRPHSMPGGRFHTPVWSPYELYGRVDGVYGFKAWEAHDGFTAAQGLLNVFESAMYIAYLYLVTGRRGSASGNGRASALALLVGFSAAVMTLSKTVLYWAKEYYCDFDNIGHNELLPLIVLWIIPNGAWLIGSSYMIGSLGGEIVNGLTFASKAAAKEE